MSHGGDKDAGRGQQPMKIACLALVALLLQGCKAVAPAPVVAPDHLRFSRAIHLPAGASGEACAVLDADVFAHAASRSADDLRVFRSVPNAAGEEVPFALTESEAQLEDAVAANVLNLKLHDGHIGFDLAMPQRPYSRVELQLAAQDFYAVATVTAAGRKSDAPTYLGRFVLFDLTSRHLARSTSLDLPESSFPQLHVELQLWRLPHNAYPSQSAAIIEGATVPPSREAQTLFTPVAEAKQVEQQPGRSVVTFHVPAHVPIERIAVTLAPGFYDDFLRQVTVIARPDRPSHAADTERAGGEISSVELPLYLDADREAATVRDLSFDATLAANLRSAARVEVAVENNGAAPLPITAVQLAMRQRNLCFDAVPGATYTLRYGDDALPVAVYEVAHLLQAGATPIMGSLGTEQQNGDYTARTGAQSYKQRHPELLWAVLLLLLALLGAVARHNTKHRRRRG